MCPAPPSHSAASLLQDKGPPGKAMAPLRILWMWLLVAGTQGELSPRNVESMVPSLAESQGSVLPGTWITGASPGLLSCVKPWLPQSWLRGLQRRLGVPFSSSWNQRDQAGGAHRAAEP